MSDDYIFDPIETDPDDLQTQAYDYLQSKWPDWVPNEGNLATWMIVALSDIIAEALDVGSDVPPEIFRYLGEKLVGVPPVLASSATVNTTWIADQAYGVDQTLEQGTRISLPGGNGDPVYFETIVPNTLDAGQTEITGVTVRAIEPGVEGNSLGGASFVATPVDPVAWVDSIETEAFTTGGADEEDVDTYLNRLSRQLTLLTPRPILPKDFEILTRNIAEQAGVKARVLAIDGYNPADGTTNNERMITVTAIDLSTGADISPTLLADIEAQLEASREVNFIVHAVNPYRTVIDVNYAIVVRPGYDPVETLAETDAAIESFLNPANWGSHSFEAPGETTVWESRKVVYHQDLSTVINNVRAVDRWTSLTMRKGADPYAASDVTLHMTDPTALVSAGTVAGAVV